MSTDQIKTVAVLGAGTMGNGIAHVFARAGYHVILRDVEQRFLERGLETVAKNLDREIKKGKLPEAEHAAVWAAFPWLPTCPPSAPPILWWKPSRKKSRSSARC